MAGEPGTSFRISHFRIERELGRDPIGYVVQAVDEQLERPVALRIVRAADGYAGKQLAQVRARLRETARRAALLNHPNLVTIHEFRSLVDIDLVVMEMVDGESLEAMRGRGARWTVLDAARVLARVADALAAAHDAGLVHGRVRLTNVKVRPDGRIKLLDLGIPHDPADESASPTMQDDVRALVGIAGELLAPSATPAAPESDPLADALRDPVKSRARYGFLAPVLSRGLADREHGGYTSAGEFRDAVVQALDSATWRTSAEPAVSESRWSTRVVGPDRHAVEDRLPADARSLSALGRVPPPTTGPRLVLPPDLAEGTTVPDHLPLAGWYGVHRHHGLSAAARALAERVGVRQAILGVFAIAVIAASWVAFRRIPSDRPADDGASSAAPIGNADSAAERASLQLGRPVAGTGSATPGPGSDSGVARAQTAAPAQTQPVLLSAMVRAGPPGATIRILGRADTTWADAVELAVPSGDSLLVEVSRPGYVSATHVFKGSRISVSLQPDSVTAEFQANVPAEVYLMLNNRPRRLGTTNFQAQLPTGSHRILFRALGQEDWSAVHAMPRAGNHYLVAKTNYVTEADLVVTVAGTWAFISVDGGPNLESPQRYERLAVGPHVVRISRDGFQTIVDTVVVRPGPTATRTYALRRGS